MVWPALGRLLQIGGVAAPFPSPFGQPVPQLGDSYPAVDLAAGLAVEQKEWLLGDLSLVAKQAYSALALAAEAADLRQAAAGGPTHLGWSPETVTWPNPAPNGHLPETIHSSSAGFPVAAVESTGVGSVSARP
jgi:hypothetical protein